MSALVLYVLCISSVAYIVRVLLFDGSFGPFESSMSKYRVHDDFGYDGASEYSVSLWDHVRRMFGAYRIEDTKTGLIMWYTTVRMNVWRCPKCLSFWLTLLVSAPFVFITGYVVYFPVVHLSMTFFVQFIVFVQLWLEGD